VAVVKVPSMTRRVSPQLVAAPSALLHVLHGTLVDVPAASSLPVGEI
jgi:hypothetical protein